MYIIGSKSLFFCVTIQQIFISAPFCKVFRGFGVLYTPVKGALMDQLVSLVYAGSFFSVLIAFAFAVYLYFCVKSQLV